MSLRQWNQCRWWTSSIFSLSCYCSMSGPPSSTVIFGMSCHSEWTCSLCTIHCFFRHHWWFVLYYNNYTNNIVFDSSALQHQCQHHICCYCICPECIYIFGHYCCCYKVTFQSGSKQIIKFKELNEQNCDVIQKIIMLGLCVNTFDPTTKSVEALKDAVTSWIQWQWFDLGSWFSHRFRKVFCSRHIVKKDKSAG